MRISDWSSDVCSSDLRGPELAGGVETSGWREADKADPHPNLLPEGDRKSVVSGKSVSVRVDRGGRRIIKKKKTLTTTRANRHTNDTYRKHTSNRHTTDIYRIHHSTTR